MFRYLVAWLFAAFVAVAAGEARAVATAQVNVTGQALGETTLQLIDDQGMVVKEDDDSDRRAGIWWWRNKRPGTYTLRTLRGGAVVREQRITLADNVNNVFRVDSATGTAVAVQQLTPEQNIFRFAATVLGGIKRTPFEAEISSVAVGRSAEGGLEDTIGIGGLEGRYYLTSRSQQLQMFGAGFFLAGSYLQYFGGGDRNFFGDFHPTQGNDTGASAEEEWSLRLALGKEFNIYQRVGMAFMLGAHLTRVEAEAFTDESGGGGIFNRFTRNRTLFGPYAAAELILPLAVASFTGLNLLTRIEAMYMPEIDINGTSAINNFDYAAEIEGGLQLGLLLGLMFRF